MKIPVQAVNDWDTSASKAALCCGSCSGGSPSGGAFGSRLEASVYPPGDASAKEYCEGSDGTQAGGSVVLDVAKRMGLSAVSRVRFVRGRARYRTWCELKHCAFEWAPRSLQREFELVIMVEVVIGEMYGSD